MNIIYWYMHEFREAIRDARTLRSFENYWEDLTWRLIGKVVRFGLILLRVNSFEYSTNPIWALDQNCWGIISLNQAKIINKIALQIDFTSSNKTDFPYAECSNHINICSEFPSLHWNKLSNMYDFVGKYLFY